MAGLTGTQIKNTYGDVLQLGNSGAGITASLQVVADGLGNATSFSISTVGAKLTCNSSNTDETALAAADAPVLLQNVNAANNYVFLPFLNSGGGFQAGFACLMSGTGATAGGRLLVYQRANGSSTFSPVAAWTSVGYNARSGDAIGWCNNATDSTGSFDTGTYRVVAGVVGACGTSTSSAGWLQNVAGEAALASNFTKANATLGATNLSVTLKAGRSYRIDGLLQVSNSTAGEGAQFTFNGGAASATTFFVRFDAKAATAPVAVVEVSAALATVLNYSTVTGTAYIRVSGFIKVNAGGTLILQAAENTTASGTMTLGAGSWLAFYDTVPL